MVYDKEYPGESNRGFGVAELDGGLGWRNQESGSGSSAGFGRVVFFKHAAKVLAK